jgi:NADH-quinone oxidoreductase subunit A
MTYELATIAIFFVLGFLFLFGTLIAGAIVRPKDPFPEKYIPYECGVSPVGTPWIQFNPRFYTIALIFLIFDVEIAVLYPCALLFQERQGAVLLEILVFVAILMVGLAYVWVKGDLEWVKATRRLAENPPGKSEERIPVQTPGV